MHSSFDRADLLSVLKRCRELTSRSDDSDWSCMDVKDLSKNLDDAIQRLENSMPVEIKFLRFLFVVTGPLQETSLSNGWAEEFLVLAELFDKIVGESP